MLAKQQAAEEEQGTEFSFFWPIKVTLDFLTVKAAQAAIQQPAQEEEKV